MVRCGFDAQSLPFTACLFDPEKSLAWVSSLQVEVLPALPFSRKYWEGVKIKWNHDVMCFVNCETAHKSSFLFSPNIYSSLRVKNVHNGLKKPGLIWYLQVGEAPCTQQACCTWVIVKIYIIQYAQYCPAKRGACFLIFHLKKVWPVIPKFLPKSNNCVFYFYFQLIYNRLLVRSADFGW